MDSQSVRDVIRASCRGHRITKRNLYNKDIPHQLNTCFGIYNFLLCHLCDQRTTVAGQTWDQSIILKWNVM